MTTVEELEQIFASMDKDGNGELTVEEVTDALVNKKKFDPEFVQEFFKNFDRNSDGKVTLDECKKSLQLIPEPEFEYSAWRSVFEQFDKDGSGYIEADELPAIMEEIGSKTKYDSGHFQRWIEQHDKDKDGKISYEEFLQWIRGPKA